MVGGIDSILRQGTKILAPHTQKPKHNNPHVLPLKKKAKTKLDSGKNWDFFLTGPPWMISGKIVLVDEKKNRICMCLEHIVNSRNLWLGFSYLSFISIIFVCSTFFFFTFRFYHKFFLLIFHADVLKMWSRSVLKRRKHGKVMGFCGEGEGYYLNRWCSYSGECPFHSSDRCLAEVLHL